VFSELHRDVALVWVVGLTALSISLLRRRFLFCGMTNRFASYYSSLCEQVGWLSGTPHVLISPDRSGNTFFLLTEVLEGNKKEKDCSGQRDQESLWNTKRVLQIFFNIITLYILYGF
jgi:hypothetical protein